MYLSRLRRHIHLSYSYPPYSAAFVLKPFGVFFFHFHMQQIGPIPVEMRNNMTIALVTRILGIRLTVDPENNATTRNPIPRPR